MAWLHSLAGRAEDLLNKIDQNAATVLNESHYKLSDNEIQAEVSDNDIIPSKDHQLYVKNNEMSESINSTTSNSSFPNSLVEDDVDQEHNHLTSTGFIYDMVEKSSSNGSSGDENSIDVSIKSLDKSDKMSSSSSVHNSFLLGGDSKIVQDKLEIVNQDLNKKLLDMHHLYSELRNENTNLQFQLERANEQFAISQIEKDQYMARAQRILLEKETLISVKQENNIDEETKTFFTTYKDELKKEVEFYQTQSSELTQKNIHLMKEVQSLQMRHQVIQNGLQSTNQSLEQTLLNERKSRAIAEEDCSQKNRELHKKNQDILQLQELLKVKNDEIQKLKEAVIQKVHSNDIEDMEFRITSLTNTLMLKQNALEMVTAEKHALRLQLEKLENEYKKNVEKMIRSRVEIVRIEEPDDSIPVPKFLRVSPFDAGVTRRVKHAYSTLDAVSIRTGIFLRRYPVTRVFVFCYMVLLHIWVLIILFLYVPSNH